MKPLISVIVPVYKVEKYLEKCIESILFQKYENIEILLINDGSPDNCGSICDGFAQKDKRIKVFHKENGGLSDARNMGLHLMHGDYVTFVDSDDFLHEDYILALITLIEKYKTKIAVTLFKHVKEGEIISLKEGNKEKKLSRLDALKAMFYQDLFDNNVTAKLFHISLFKNIEFPKGLLYEDLLTTYKLLLSADDGVAFSDLQNYYYLLRDDSIEGSPFDEKKFNSLMFIVDNLENVKLKSPELTNCINCRILSLLFHLLFETKKKSKYEKEIFKLIKKYKMLVFIDNKARKKARVAAAISFFGLDFIRFFSKFGKSRG